MTRRGFGLLVFCLGAALGLQVQSIDALDLQACDRRTHISHAGESGHQDLGDGRVAYTEWWSQEGVYVDLVIADCGTGQHLVTRMKEEQISARPPFDRTERVMDIVAQQMRASPALFSLDRLAQALKGTGRDIRIARMSVDPCACAALYPELRSDRAGFELRR